VFDIFIQVFLIAFYGQYIVRVFFTNLGRNLFLTPERINSDDTVGKIKRFD